MCSSETKLCTLQLPIEQGKTKSVLDQIADEVKQRHRGAPFTIPFVAAVISSFVKKFGANPGKAHPKYPNGCGQHVAFNIIGSLWIALGESGRTEFALDTIIAAGVCPALVCLIGQAQSGKNGAYSFSLQIMAMAPYADCVLAVA